MEPQKQNGKRPFGAPRMRGRPSAGARVALGLRVTPGMFERIKAECTANGRSQSQDVEMRLERSFWLDDMLKAMILISSLPER